MGSPFTARLCLALPDVLDPATRTGSRVARWSGDPRLEALALRLCGGLHWLVRQGRKPLAAVYPPREPSEPELRDALTETIIGADDTLAGFLDGPPRTNEVGRSSVLLGGLQVVAAETGATLKLYEIGAGAGLNLLLDRWCHELGGGRRWGPANAPVTIACDWRGDAPPLVRLGIDGRVGCDLAPIDPREKTERERLLAYIWPDQAGRLARTEAALAHAARHGAVVEAADAPPWLERALAEPEEEGVARVLFHSIVWQYLDVGRQREITRVMVVAAAEATADRPLAWLRMERDSQRTTAAVILTTWPGGRTRELGRADYHGRFVEWSGVR